ncbi:SCO family protein [Cardiobacteriaceae bacterium TAE3-ERU3]|nr:SCO family protein [Cardiobacteriaceae bacterium TAE3-ERU3]
MNDKNIKLAKMIIAVCLVSLVAMVSLYVVNRDRPLGDRARAVYEYGGDFTLETSQGEISLNDFAGKVLVIYFGFMNCTEACPESMATLQTAFNRLSDEELAQSAGLFISVDPERDNVSDLEEFTQYFHPAILGATSDKKTIDAITEKYGVFFSFSDLDGSNLNYTVDHASRFYMVDPRGRLRTTMSHSTTPNELAAKIRELINEYNSSTEQSNGSA